MFVACNHPSQDNDDLPPPVPLAMDGNALNPRRSPQLENHYEFLTGKRGASCDGGTTDNNQEVHRTASRQARRQNRLAEGMKHAVL
jgi:hypothetical protein